LRARTFRKRLVPNLLLLPLTAWIFFFALVPMFYGLWLSVHNAFIENLSHPTWAGLANYIYLFRDPAWGRALVWSLRFALISVTAQMVVGVAIAQFFNRSMPAKGMWITLLLIPMVVSAALIGTMFRLLFNEFVGPIQYLLNPITGGGALLGPDLVNLTIIVADSINNIPFVFINIYAALQSVPTELLEAAMVDGASPWQRFWHIVVPMILPIAIVTWLMRLLAAFLVFELVFTLTGGGPGNMTQSTSIYIYRRAFSRSDFGMANAASFSLALLLLAPALLVVRRMMRPAR
jgi:multiple sugar transport system permease protein